MHHRICDLCGQLLLLLFIIGVRFVHGGGGGTAFIGTIGSQQQQQHHRPQQQPQRRQQWRRMMGSLVPQKYHDKVGMTTPVAAITTTTSAATASFNSPDEAASTTRTTSTTTGVYPTQRGTTVDARQIVMSSSSRSYITAVLVSHCLFATEQMAEESLLRLRTAEADFASLVTSVSACNMTRSEQGIIGWINLPTATTTTTTSEMGKDDHNDDDNNEQYDTILPRAARTTFLRMVTKPGDVVMVQSIRGYHLLQVMDIMADVRQMATFRRKRKYSSSSSTSSSSFLDMLGYTNMTYKIESMGCQMNTADSERIEGQLTNLGIQPHQTDSGGGKLQRPPDIVILNTCSIRDHAEQKVYSYLGPHVKRKREGDNVTIVVAGCVAQQEGKKLLHRAPEIDLVMGPQYANRIGDLLEDVIVNGNQVVATAATHIMEDSTKPRRSSTIAAWVNVIYGCNERCTFCIVPTTRGVEQSRPTESIVREVTDLVQIQGYKEITLLGQNIDAYGRDMIPKQKFSDLLRKVGTIPGVQRLRFVTSHPRYMSMGVIDAVAETPSICESFHIPFQSGSNTILSAMGRGHTREKYLHIVDRIRKRIPDAAITADVIVGFPGETEQDFQDTLDLMEKVVFDSVNTAAYSPRPNTPAAIFTNQVDDDVKQERLQRINQVNLQHAAQRRARLLHQIVEVLVEERNVKVPTQVMGRTRHGYIVYSDGDIDTLRGEIVHVHIDTTETYYLSGKIVDSIPYNNRGPG